MAYKKRKRRTYKKRSYKKKYHRNNSGEEVTIVLVGLGALLIVLSSGLHAINFSSVSEAIGVAVPIILIVIACVAIGVVALVVWRLWLVIERLRQAQMTRRKTNQKYEVAMANSTFSHMNWREFEHFVGRVFEAQGYHVVVTKGSGDKGVDAKLYKGGKTLYVQAKHYKPGNNVGGPAVREFAGTILGVDGGYIVTTSDFTLDAYEHASTNPHITLINGAQLGDMIDSLPSEKRVV